YFARDPSVFVCRPHSLDLHSFPTRRSSDLQIKNILNSNHPTDSSRHSCRNLCLGNKTGTPSSRQPTILELPLYMISPSVLTAQLDRKSTRLNSSHVSISYADLCLKKKMKHD